MTIQEAKIYLPIAEDDELIDVYEEKLFEIKQFLSSNFPITKVFTAKAKKIDLLNQAFVALGGELKSSPAIPFKLNEDQNPLALFNSYVQEKFRIRGMIMNAKDGNELVALIRAYLGIVRKYAKVWKLDHEDYEGIKVSAEPDLMEMHEAVKAFVLEGKSSIDEMEKFIVARNFLIAESKRLSLWLKLDSDV